MAEARTAQRVVVAGGGAAGLDLATRLARSAPQLLVTLLEPSGGYVWRPRLHKVAAGTLDAEAESVDYLPHAARNGFAYRPGALVGLDRARRLVHLAPVPGEPSRSALPYDTLVLALGSRADDFGTPGVGEHCAFVDTRTEAEAFRESLRLAVVRALDGPAEPIAVSIVGAGATGVELAAELHRALDLARAHGLPDLRGRLRVTVIEAGPRILPALPEEVARASEGVLRDLGVEILTDAKVEAAQADGLRLEGGRLLPSVLRVWAAGIRAPSVTKGLDGLETDRSGRLVVTRTLQTTEDPDVLAMGDCASLTPEGKEKPLPATAQVAHQQARHLARHLPGRPRGGALPPFRYAPRGSLVSLGDYDAFGRLAHQGPIPGTFLGGALARLGYGLLYRQYQWTIHGARAPLVWLAEGARRLAQPPVKLD